MSARGASVPLYQQIDDLKVRLVEIEAAVAHLIEWYNTLQEEGEAALKEEEALFKDSEESCASSQPWFDADGQE